MPMHDWSRVQSGIYHNFHYRWIAAIMDHLNGGLLPKGMIAMAEQSIGGPEPDVVTVHQNDIVFLANGGGVATMTEVLPKPKTEFVIPVEVERYSSKANRVVVRHSLGKVLAVVELVLAIKTRGIRYARSSKKTLTCCTTTSIYWSSIHSHRAFVILNVSTKRSGMRLRMNRLNCLTIAS